MAATRKFVVSSAVTEKVNEALEWDKWNLIGRTRRHSKTQPLPNSVC